MSNGGGRVSIPNNMRKMIHNIKEIAGSHSDEEVYIMLKECNMDPNETTQKLLLQDTFHEVKRKRDRRKENVNKDPVESRWKPGMQGQGNRGGRGNYSSRHVSHDAGGGGSRNSASGKENGIIQVPEDSVGISILPTTSHDIKNKGTSVASSSTVIIDGPAGMASESKSVGHDGCRFSEGGNNQFVTAAAEVTKLEGPLPLNPMVEASKTPIDAFVTGDTHEQLMPSSSNIPTSRTSAPSPGVHFSSSDPVLVSSQDSRLLGAVGIIKREVGSQKIPSEQIQVVPAERKSIGVSSEVGSSFVQGKMPNVSQVVGKNQLSESSQAAPSTQGGPSVSRPSSNYSSRSPQVIGLQKAVGPSKEWKPKPTNPNLAQGSGTAVSSEVPAVPVEAKAHSHSAASVLDAKQTTSELEKKLEESQISNIQHVVIPNHLHVPEVVKLGFCFGSFDASFGLNTIHSSRPENEKSPSPSETSEGIEESVEEQPSNQNVLATVEGDSADCPPSSSHVPENLISGEGDVSSSVVPEYSESKQEADLTPGGHQYSLVNTSPNYSFGIMQPMAGSQVAPFESTEAQARDVSRLPSFVVQQPFDPASYYAQLYRSGADIDVRISPFHSTGISTKYNGNATMLSPQASQSSQEAGNSLIMSAASPTPLVTQAAAAVMQSSIAVTQQPVPVFRQPAGMHFPHYPTNYIPYGHYFSPFYVQPPAIHQFLSNGSFPPQPQAGSLYPAPPVATNKYSPPQYKPGGNTGNSTHMGLMGVPGNYGPYGSSPTGFNPSSATTGNSTSNDDLVSQFKENNAYITGQQRLGEEVVMEKEEEIWNQKKQILIEQVADKLINADDLQTKIHAARDVRKLVRKSSPVKARSKFAAAGVIQPLVFMLSSPNLEAREASLLALLNLAARNERNKVSIATSGAIPPLVDLLKFQTGNLRELATAAILTLSSAPPNKPTIASSGAAPLLVQILSSGSVQGRVDAVTALHNLSTCEEVPALVLDARAVPPLINLLKECKKYSKFAEKTTALLEILSMSEEGRTAITDADGGILTLVESVEDGSLVSTEHAVGALLALCRSCRSKYRELILKEGAIPGLLQLTVEGTPEAQHRARTLLDLLRDSPPEKILASSVLERIVCDIAARADGSDKAVETAKRLLQDMVQRSMKLSMSHIKLRAASCTPSSEVPSV